MGGDPDGTVEIQLPYGDAERRIRVPGRNLAEILTPRKVEADLGGEKDRLAEALEHPIGTSRLEEMLQPDQRVAILVDDMARPTPISRILPSILDRLEAAGVPDDQVTIVIALGTHRPMTVAEIRARVGDQVAGRIRVQNHDFRDPGSLVYVGDASGGIPVWLNRRVKEADFRIGVGNVVPHGVAGWAGGGKIVYPGVAGEQTVDGFHGAFGTDLRNRVGAIDAPIRADIDRLVSHVGLEFIVNTILTGDGIIYRVVAGDFRLAHRRGVAFAREVYEVSSQGPVDIAVVSAYPADLDFWQAGKALYSGELLVRDGGTLILVAACPEGVAQNHDLLYYSSLGPDELKVRLEGCRVEDRAAAAAARRVGLVSRRVRVVMVSQGLNGDDASKLGFDYAQDLQGALDAALARHGEGCRLSVLTHGAEVFPRPSRG